MKKQIKSCVVLVGLALVSAMAACAPYDKTTSYWQKSETHSALYMQGPKAQQTLEQDVAFCVAEIQELVRQGAIRKSLPEDTTTRKDAVVPKEDRDAYWNTPQRYGAKYVDHSDYHDFDGCMANKGWERMKYAPYEQIHIANDSYERLLDSRWERTRYVDDSKPQSLAGKSGPYYNHLND